MLALTVQMVAIVSVQCACGSQLLAYTRHAVTDHQLFCALLFILWLPTLSLNPPPPSPLVIIPAQIDRITVKYNGKFDFTCTYINKLLELLVCKRGQLQNTFIFQINHLVTPQNILLMIKVIEQILRLMNCQHLFEGDR
jgi:hypothetical protein